MPDYPPASSKQVTLVGADIFVRCVEVPQVPERSGPFELAWIGNRGVKVWPGAPPDILLVDLYRCRYLAAEGQTATSADVRALLAAIEDPALHWVHVEKLILLDGVPGFSAV